MPRLYRVLQRLLGVLVRLFFREVDVAGRANVPDDRGLIVVSWHPNGLVDPGLILTQFPRQVVFGARHGLFKWPLLGWLLRGVGTVPIFRAADAKAGDAARRDANEKSLDALAQAVASGSASALFPEGVSHDEPHPVELKTGAARLYYRARAMAPPGAKPPSILPVGLHYDGKMAFRSRALVRFHEPLALPPELDVTPAPDEDPEVARERARKLTELVERVLHDAVGATEDWATHYLLHRARKLLRAERAVRAGAEPGKPGIEEKTIGFARIRAGYNARLRTDPAIVAKIRSRLEAYDRDLRALGVEDHDLDRDPKLFSLSLAVLLLLNVVFLFLLLPPVLVFGYVANAPTALALWALSRLAAKQRKDVATIKLLVGALAFPLTWAAAAVLGALAHERLHSTFPSLPNRPLLAGATVGLLASLGGVAALRYLHRSQETARALRVRLTRMRRSYTVARLRKERSELADVILVMAEGLELPGEVAADGSVRAS